MEILSGMEIVILIGVFFAVGIAGVLGYEFWYKPRTEKGDPPIAQQPPPAIRNEDIATADVGKTANDKHNDSKGVTKILGDLDVAIWKVDAPDAPSGNGRGALTVTGGKISGGSNPGRKPPPQAHAAAKAKTTPKPKSQSKPDLDHHTSSHNKKDSNFITSSMNNLTKDAKKAASTVTSLAHSLGW